MKRRIDAGARRDIAVILDWSQDNFGTAARRRYEQLIDRALQAVAADPSPLGSRAVADSPIRLRLYHLRNVAAGMPTHGSPTRAMLSSIVFVEPDLVVILRLLHDAMDMPAHFDGND